jgi:serine/threonine protein kinase
MSSSQEKSSSKLDWNIKGDQHSEMMIKSKESIQNSINSKLSPLPKPDFSSIEKKESAFTYKQKGSYKKPKSNVPESPMKSPNQKFFTPVKLQMKNLFGGNANTCRKLNFAGGEDDITMDDQTTENFTDTFKTRGKSLLERLDEEDKLTSNDISPEIKQKKQRTSSTQLITKMNKDFSGTGMDIDMDERETNVDEVNNTFAIRNMQSIYDDICTNSNSQMSTDSFQKKESRFEKDFEVIKTLDTGAFGIVYKCLNKHDDKIYAVKKSIKHSSNYDYNATESFINNFKLKTSNVFAQFCVRYTDCWLEREAHDHTLTENHLFIIQEYCRYGDLLDYLEKVEKTGFKFNEEFYWDLIFEMMCGVYYLHQCDYIHFDIKPGNFLIDENGCVKLGDFGLSRETSAIKKGEDLYEGDSGYLAPEFFGNVINCENIQINDNSQISNKCDVFSLGLTILEILCKIELPQNGVLWKTIRAENFEVPEEFINNSNIKINKKMIQLVKSLLIINPEGRPSILSIFENSEFEQISSRYKKLLNKEYIRYLNPKKYMEMDDIDDISPMIYNKRSNSYKLSI